MTNEPDDDFWSATPELTTIHQWARARYAAPWAVFGAVLLRVAATTGPHVQLPAVIGGRAALNLMAVFVAPSGGGKGVSDAVARLAWPAAIHEEGLGSGQGIAELFKRTKEPEDRIDRAIFSVSEIDHLTALSANKENNTRATLKAAVMGERIGSKGASSATSRAVPQNSYRMCLSVGGQPGHCSVIIDDASGGMPQRVLWFPSIDPEMPDIPGAQPEPLNHRLPGRLTRRHDDSTIVTEIIYGTEEIAATMIAARLAHSRGEGDPLDGHKALTRAKVAATMAIMGHRTVVSELDWQLSERVMEVSSTTRDWVIEHAKQVAKAKVRDRAMSRAAGEQFISDHKLDRAKKSVLRWLERDGEAAANQIRSKLKADLRDHFGAAVAELAAEELILEIHVDRGARYRLNAQVQGVPEVQGHSSQVNEGVPEVQGVPERTSAESNNPSSPCPGCDTSPARRDTGKCNQCTLATVGAHEFLVCWFRANTLSGEWVEPATALTAGKEVGYKHDTLKAAQQRRGTPRIESSGTGRGSKWRLDPANFAADGQSA